MRFASARRHGVVCFIALLVLLQLWKFSPPNLFNDKESKQPQWTILLTVNGAYLDFFLNWLSSYERLGLTNDVIVVAEDDAVEKKLKRIKKYSTIRIKVLRSGLQIGTGGGPFDMFTPEYAQIVSTRPSHVLPWLETGHHILYMDADVIWARDPFPYINAAMMRGNANAADLAMQVEYFGWWGEPNYCAGIMAIAPSSNSIQMMRKWEATMLESPRGNQVPLDRLLRHTIPEITLVPLPFLRFVNGIFYFTLRLRFWAAIVHNDVLVGHADKRKRFVDHGLWNIDDKYTPYL